MSVYRRARVPGATYYFTVNLRDRHSDLLVREIDLHLDAASLSPLGRFRAPAANEADT